VNRARASVAADFLSRIPSKLLIYMAIPHSTPEMLVMPQSLEQLCVSFERSEAFQYARVYQSQGFH
jgi:hypothetical protein